MQGNRRAKGDGADAGMEGGGMETTSPPMRENPAMASCGAPIHVSSVANRGPGEFLSNLTPRRREMRR
jgi:hypothetical protein